MIERVSIAQLPSFVGQEVTLRGWLYNKRSSGKLHFLEVRDGTAADGSDTVKVIPSSTVVH